MTETPAYPHPDIKDDGLIFNMDSQGNIRLFARVEVSGLSYEQIAAVHEYAKAMRPEGGLIDLLDS
jgi:hypothetical protein